MPSKACIVTIKLGQLVQQGLGSQEVHIMDMVPKSLYGAAPPTVVSSV
jgi:hypothetical protein